MKACCPDRRWTCEFCGTRVVPEFALDEARAEVERLREEFHVLFNALTLACGGNNNRVTKYVVAARRTTVCVPASTAEQERGA